ncbi:MICOS complex subunit MIC25 isoform X2 [Cervus canadensis]|uniref:MICOS complex subunit MIC25 isoform X2 n=1 Tax=Cervus canadensis TaxID=1574408 RepID=UPI0018BB932A|nr:MICOS complex subunit MIC25 isoform X2 [Cervus canadensis]
MGSAESREGRRASFGMDEEERVRVLQGIRLSENVVNRMKDPGQPSRVGPLDPPAAALGSSGGREKDSKPPRPECGSGQEPLRVQVDPLERCDREQAVLQHELVRVATTDREAAAKPRSVTLRRGEGSADQEKQRSAQLARELESQEAELRRRDAFCKEQLGRLERQTLRATAHQGLTCVLCPHCGVPVSARRGVRLWKELNPRLHLLFCVSSSSTEEALGRPPVTSSSQPQWTLCRTNKNLETYRLSSQQFHEAAAKVEGAIKPRRVEPVCSGLQAQILRCYRDHLQEVLLCADLVRAYQHCVSSAHKG